MIKARQLAKGEPRGGGPDMPKGRREVSHFQYGSMGRPKRGFHSLNIKQ
jgi:hypothetical protein